MYINRYLYIIIFLLFIAFQTSCKGSHTVGNQYVSKWYTAAKIVDALWPIANDNIDNFELLDAGDVWELEVNTDHELISIDKKTGSIRGAVNTIDDKQAIEIAKAVLFEKYGGIIYEAIPYRAELDNGLWKVSGDWRNSTYTVMNKDESVVRKKDEFRMPKLGGLPVAIINQKDGSVVDTYMLK